MAVQDRLAIDTGGGRSTTSNAQLTYDPKTGTWVPKTVQNTNVQGSSSVTDSQSDSKSSGKTPTSSASKSGESSSKSKDAADKDYIEIEFNTLTGELTLVPSPKTIRFTVGQTLILDGLGRYLSGMYYISGISRNLSGSGGYSQTCTVIKTGFGDSLKSTSVSTSSTTTTVATTGSTPTRPAEVSKVSDAAFKVGDKVQIVGDNAVYSNAHDGVKVPNWVKAKTDLKVTQISSDGSRALLQTINSWTYIKFLKKL